MIVNSVPLNYVIFPVFPPGRQEHKELFKKKSKLTRFFQENNSSGSVSEKKKKWESKKHDSKIIIPSVNKDQEKYNASHVGNTSHVIGHNSNHPNKHVKKEKAAIWNLVCKLFNISKESEACKEKSHSKKAMIWPTKMLDLFALLRIRKNWLNFPGNRNLLKHDSRLGVKLRRSDAWKCLSAGRIFVRRDYWSVLGSTGSS